MFYRKTVYPVELHYISVTTGRKRIKGFLSVPAALEYKGRLEFECPTIEIEVIITSQFSAVH